MNHHVPASSSSLPADPPGPISTITLEPPDEPLPLEPLRGAAPAASSPTSPDRFAIAASLPRVPYTVQSLGPVGRVRSGLLTSILSALTLGLSGVRWSARATREAVEFDPRMQARSRRTAAAVVGPVLLCLAVAAAAGARLAASRMGHHVDLRLGEDVTRWLVLAPLVAPTLCALWSPGLGAFLMTLERVRIVEDRAGVAPDQQLRPARLTAWLFLPVLGMAVVTGRAQRRLNRVWATSV